MENVIMPLIGGLLIGLSSSIMLGGLGRITGISGIVSSTLGLPSKDHQWRYHFILGLFIGGFIFFRIRPEFFQYEITSSIPLLITGGLLVGFGTRLGSGCTSGHGVCGIPRLAKRSLVATLTFMAFGIITVGIMGVI